MRLLTGFIERARQMFEIEHCLCYFKLKMLYLGVCESCEFNANRLGVGGPSGQNE